MGDSMRRLSFSAVQGNDTTDLSTRVKDLTSDLERLSQDVEQRLDNIKSTAANQQRLGGGRQALKRQIQSLKSSLLNLGQKETFSESIVGFHDGVDFKTEADRSAGAVESAEEDLKELKKANEQDVEALHQAIQMVCNYHEQYKNAVSRVSQHLQNSNEAVRSLHQKSTAMEVDLGQPPSPSGPDLGEDADLEALLELETERAAQLEAEIAEAGARCVDLSAALAVETEAEEQRQTEITLLELQKLQAKSEAEDTHLGKQKWYDEVLSIMALPWSGISDVSVQADSVHVHLSQRIPSTWDETSDEYTAVEHKLVVSLNDTGRLASATLQPPSFDISGDVECARFLGTGGGSLAHLVTAVRGHVRDHFRRQFLINEASISRSIHATGSTSIVRAQLPVSCLEAEVDIPFGWPANGRALRLLGVESPISAVDNEALFKAITSSAPVLLGEGTERPGIKEFLATADVVAQSLHTYKA